MIFVANPGLELRDKCGQGNMTVVTMKIGIVISGGDVSGINNFIFQVAKLASAEITIFNGGIPSCTADGVRCKNWG